ncbi:MAG: hypothetical protein R3362_05925 [Rhodothermales bacterium]|nr:hypothetical protein [Rhodothermales bacterium]
MPPRLLALLLVPLALVAAGCDEPAAPPTPAEAARADSVLTLLRTADRTDLARAFERLEDYSYRVVTRTEQLGPAGDVVAATEDEVAVGPEGRRVLRRDTRGDYDFGAFTRFAGDGEDEAPANPALLILPEEPAYLSPRARETFRFAFGPDTMLGGQPVETLLVRAAPDQDGQQLRAATLWLDAETGDLVGVRLLQVESSFLFGERSRMTVLLRPGPGGAWLPDRVAAETALRAPLTEERRLRLVRSYGLE